jgi:membrane protease YdiL (CAAX protease family)
VNTILTSDNRLFTLARQGRRLPSALAAIAVVPATLALLIVSQVMGRLLLRPIFPRRVESVADQIAEIIGFLIIYLSLWFLLRYWSKRPFRSLGFERRRVLQPVLGGAFAAGLMVLAMAGLAVTPGAIFAQGQLRAEGLAAVGTSFLLLLTIGVQSSAEEALFRGWLLPVIGSRYGPWIGILVSSLMFVLAHAFSAPTPLGLLNLILFGTFAAVWALVDGGLWGACAWHTVWNWIEGGLLGMAVDRSMHPGLFVSIRTTGPNFITGGDFGPEGGLAATVVLLAGIGMILIRTRRPR